LRNDLSRSPRIDRRKRFSSSMTETPSYINCKNAHAHNVEG
jgi:hypothetical protein